MSNLWVIPEELEDLATSEYAYEACKSASYLLWALSGRKFSGVTQVTETYKYVHHDIDSNWIFEAQTEGLFIYEYFNAPYVPYTKLKLRGVPVSAVISVFFSSDMDNPVDPTHYAILDSRYIQFDSVVTDDISITYTYGALPPQMGRSAARMLAIQFALLWEGSQDCTLPDRVTAVTRQGISYTILDQQDFVEDLRTGVYAVDLFLKSTNPDRALRRARVYSPDLRRGRRTNS